MSASALAGVGDRKKRVSDSTPSDQSVNVDPYLVALLVCERVIVEEGTGAKTLVSVFSEVTAPSLPTTKVVAVYAKVTDAEGAYTFRLDYVRVSSDRVVERIEFRPDPIVDRLRYYELVFTLPVSIEDAGLYEFRLYANDAYLGGISFTVRRVD